MRVIWKKTGPDIPEGIDKYRRGMASRLDIIQAGLPNKACDLEMWLCLEIPKQEVTGEMLPVNEDMVTAVCIEYGPDDAVSKEDVALIFSELESNGIHTTDAMLPFTIDCEESTVFGFMAEGAADELNFEVNEDSDFGSALRTEVDGASISCVKGVYDLAGIKTEIIAKRGASR